MTDYVLGFAFSPDLERVVLIQKQKPPFQHGKFNGIGGKIEPTDESVEWAMLREFREETSVHVGKWIQYVTLSGPGWKCKCFFSILTQQQFDSCTTREKEFVVKPLVKELPTNCMRNLHWLIPMALNWDAACVEVLYVADGNK